MYISDIQTVHVHYNKRKHITEYMYMHVSRQMYVHVQVIYTEVSMYVYMYVKLHE